MNEKMSKMQIISLALTLFAMFFGAGNMIFPPAMGALAQGGYLWALAGFIVTDAGIAILAIIAIVNVGNNFDDLGNKVGKRFALVFSVIIYLLIGPLFALPRCGSVSFEMGIAPITNGFMSTGISSILYTAIFFGLTYLLSMNKNKLVDIIGKVLTPLLLISIACIFIAMLTSPHVPLVAPDPSYQNAPFFKGLIEGYLALDGPAGLVFAMVVIEAVKSYHITERKNIIKYTAISGLLAALFLGIVYFALTYIGAHSIGLGSFSNGSQLLNAVSTSLLGSWGRLILGVAVILACLTTSIGLVTCFADYIHKLCPKYSYHKIAAVVCLFSFVIANVGLTTLITYTLPILIMLYPVSVVLMIVSFFDKKIKNAKEVYIFAMLFAFFVSFFTGMDSLSIHLGFLHDMVASLPFYDLGIAWILPSCVGAMLGLIISKFRNKSVSSQ
ncbi:MAG: branched-chain amino acid transport system II carrier protein [Erysipelotrichaceae bacterium]